MAPLTGRADVEGGGEKLAEEAVEVQQQGVVEAEEELQPAEAEAQKPPRKRRRSDRRKT